MRTLATLIVLLMALPAASASVLLEDADGDAQFTAGGQDTGNDRARLADLESLEVTEDDEGVFFTLEHGPVPSPGFVYLDDVEYNVHFRHGDQPFVLTMRLWFPIPDGLQGRPMQRAILFTADADGNRLDALDEVEVLDSESTIYQAKVPRDLLRDRNGVPPTAGRMLEDFFVESRSSELFSFSTPEVDASIDQPYQYHDRMPDEGFGQAPFVSEVGLPQSGVGLHSTVPLRWSNGEETSFAYSVDVQEWAGEAQHVTFSVQDVPNGWTVSVPDPVHLEAGANKTVDLAAHVPFAHDHGATTTFRLIATSDRQDSLGQIDLGVHYPEIPQPTGHHNMLFVHSQDLGENLLFDTVNTAVGQDARYRAFVNTMEQDGEDVPVPGDKRTITFDEDNVPRPLYSWRLPLDPDLRMGLNFDLASEGTAVFAFDSPVDTLGATFEGVLRIAPPGMESQGGNFFDEDGVVAKLPKVRVDGGDSISFETSVVPTEYGDEVLYDPDQQLYLDLFVMPLRPEVILTPSVGVDLISGRLQLPLEEYHDTVRVPVTLEQQELIEEVQPDSVPDEGPAAKDTPGLGAALAGVALAAVVIARRRRD